MSDYKCSYSRKCKTRVPVPNGICEHHQDVLVLKDEIIDLQSKVKHVDQIALDRKAKVNLLRIQVARGAEILEKLSVHHAGCCVCEACQFVKLANE